MILSESLDCQFRSSDHFVLAPVVVVVVVAAVAVSVMLLSRDWRRW